MGGSISNYLHLYASLWLAFFFFFIHFSLLIASENGGNGSNSANVIIPSLAPPPQSQPFFKSKGSTFKPTVAVIVGVLTTVFSLTFLLLLYAKHCRRGDSLNPFSSSSITRDYPPVTDRKNSGIDRVVIDSLPIFRFASLRGQKDGLECAVCLNRFESTEVLRLLPKCKHAFHVECVDTWLDAHSTCPLCRYRVDPEDILLVEDNRILYQSSSETQSRSSVNQHTTPDLRPAVSRVSGRHSFAGNSLEVIVETPKAAVGRRSLDSWNSRKKKRNSDSNTNRNDNNNTAMADVGCFDRLRKDELLLAENKGKDVLTEERRLEHRIIISGGTTTTDIERERPHHRWSDVQPSDLLFLQSEMILSDSSHRFSRSRPLNNKNNYNSSTSRSGRSWGLSSGGSNGGSNVMNVRSVSEITGLSRFRSNEKVDGDGDGEQQEQRRRNSKQRQQEEQRKLQEGAVSRWMAWISQSNFHHHQQQQQPPHQGGAVHGTMLTQSSSSSPSPSSVV